MDEEAIVQTLYAMRDREDKTGVLKILGKKAHIIQGEFDPLIDAGDMLKTAEKTGVNYRLIKDIGHMGRDESTDEVVTLLNQSLEENHCYPVGLRHGVYDTAGKRQHGVGNDGGGGRNIDDAEMINVLKTAYQYKF